VPSLGVGAAGQPYGGHRYAAGRDIGRVNWPRVYDLISRLWPIYGQAQLAEAYREGVNRILAAHGVAWDLGEDGRLRRALPVPAQAQINAVFVELSDPRFAPALQYSTRRAMPMMTGLVVNEMLARTSSMRWSPLQRKGIKDPAIRLVRLSHIFVKRTL